MRTLILQVVGTVATLAFGLASLRVARHPGPFEPAQRSAWRLTGLAFGAMGVLCAVQDVGAVTAFVAGPGTWTWETYLRWAPAGNHSRAFLMLGFALLLIAVPFLKDRALVRLPRAAVGVLALGALTGALAGWLEGSWVGAVHYTAIATSGAMLLVALGIALLVHLARDTMDRILWLCLCTYGLHLAVGVVWYGALAWIDVPDAWHPPVWMIALISAATAAAMLGFVARRLALARRGVRVPALLESADPRPAPVFF